MFESIQSMPSWVQKMKSSRNNLQLSWISRTEAPEDHMKMWINVEVKDEMKIWQNFYAIYFELLRRWATDSSTMSIIIIYIRTTLQNESRVESFRLQWEFWLLESRKSRNEREKSCWSFIICFIFILMFNLYDAMLMHFIPICVKRAMMMDVEYFVEKIISSSHHVCAWDPFLTLTILLDLICTFTYSKTFETSFFIVLTWATCITRTEPALVEQLYREHRKCSSTRCRRQLWNVSNKNIIKMQLHFSCAHALQNRKIVHNFSHFATPSSSLACIMKKSLLCFSCCIIELNKFQIFSKPARMQLAWNGAKILNWW